MYSFLDVCVLKKKEKTKVGILVRNASYFHRNNTHEIFSKLLTFYSCIFHRGHKIVTLTRCKVFNLTMNFTEKTLKKK